MGVLFAGHYELVDVVGAGGTGSVWRAWDHRQQTYVAAKLVRQSDAAGLIRFVREHSLTLHHPHVLIPRAWAGSEEQVLFSADLVRGGAVSELLGQYGPLPPAWVVAVLDQVLDALDEVHRRGVAHCDVRPATLLLEPSGAERPHVWLSGFAAARSDLDHRQDLYGVGMLAAELLTGLPPDPAVGVGPPPLGVPEPLWRWIQRLAAGRPASAMQARVELARTGLVPTEWPRAELIGVEVPDRLGELPPGWAPDGPVPEEADRRATTAAVGPVYEDLPMLPQVQSPYSLAESARPLRSAASGGGEAEVLDRDDREPPSHVEPIRPMEPTRPPMGGPVEPIEPPPLPERIEPAAEHEPARAADSEDTAETGPLAPAAGFQPEPEVGRRRYSIGQPVPLAPTGGPTPPDEPTTRTAPPTEYREPPEPLPQRALEVQKLRYLDPPPPPPGADEIPADVPPLQLEPTPGGAGRWWLLGLLVLLVLGGIGFVVYTWFWPF